MTNDAVSMTQTSLETKIVSPSASLKKFSEEVVSAKAGPDAFHATAKFNLAMSL